MGRPEYSPVPHYSRVSYLQPHWTRRKEIMQEHPEVESLQGTDFGSMFCVFGWVGAQVLMAYVVERLQLNWLLIFVAAYVIGAFLCHGLWVMIHELTHDLVLSSSVGNTILLLFSNTVHVIPTGVSFRFYHRVHHSHLNETYGDPDVPLPIEDKLFGHTVIGKATWLSLFSIFQGFRVLSMPAPIETAFIMNWIFNGVFVYYVLAYIGMKALIYLVLSSLFGIGFLLHPLGARWIAEHWAIKPLQETYSYYGPINKFAFNIGYHNEHHDFPGIPWSKLPTLKKVAPEYYEPLFQHSSYIMLLIHFITNRNFTLKSRVVRWPKNKEGESDKDEQFFSSPSFSSKKSDSKKMDSKKSE